ASPGPRSGRRPRRSGAQKPRASHLHLSAPRNPPSMRRKLLIAGAAAVALAAGGVGIARAVGEGDEKVTGPAADRAGAAAVDIVGGGRVTGVEREDDDGAAWEVEVVKSDGSKVEVE